VNQLGPTGCSSSIHLWALRHREDRALKQQPLLAQLAVEQQQYPTPEALCAQVRPWLMLVGSLGGKMLSTCVETWAAGSA
jgi:hypothetical protein